MAVFRLKTRLIANKTSHAHVTRLHSHMQLQVSHQTAVGSITLPFLHVLTYTKVLRRLLGMFRIRRCSQYHTTVGQNENFVKTR
jgi:hypothetical protein